MLPSPVRLSAKLVPIRFSMPFSVTLPKSAPLAVPAKRSAVTPLVAAPEKSAVSPTTVLAPPISVSPPAVPTSTSSPPLPSMVLVRASPVRTSFRFEPVSFSKLTALVWPKPPAVS